LDGGRWRQWFLALLLFAGIVVAALHWGDVKKFADLVSKAEPLWLLVALALQFLTYVSLAAEWKLVLGAGGCPQSIWRLIPLTITKLFADQVIPTAGMSGNIVLVDRLVAVGARREVAVAAVILAIVAYYASYAVAAVLASILLGVHSELSMLVVGVIGTFLCVAAVIPASALWLQKKGKTAVPRPLRSSSTVREFFDLVGKAPAKLVRDRRLITELSLLNGTVFVIDALTLLFCLFSLGETASLGATFAAFMVASMVMTLGPIPLGLGSFEATCIAMLRLGGVPFEAALSATLLFRGFSLWLPLVLGMGLARRTLRHKSA
jgi:glycosyltransferase 2 family protein